MIFDLPPNGLNLLAAPNSANDLGNAKLGYPATIVLQDPTQAAAPSDISDFCSPLVTTPTSTAFPRPTPVTATSPAPAPRGGINTPTPGVNTPRVRYRNPSVAGTYRYFLIAGSQRDSDGDGLENGFDTCPTTPLPATTPGLPSPTPSTATATCCPTPPHRRLRHNDLVKNTNPDGDAGTSSCG